MNTKEFIENAKRIHGNKYDYTETVYVNYKQKVKIICPRHGEFWQTPNNHLAGYEGCPKCALEQKQNRLNKGQEKFLEQAKQAHGNEYDYSKAHYINNDTKICIICHKKDDNGKEHGEFWQTPHSHISGQGCPKCAGKGVMDFPSFVLKAKKKYGQYYTYDEETFNGYDKLMRMSCPKHGEFWQTPHNHLKCKHGCPKCGYDNTINAMLKVKNTFIEHARQIHGDKYDYSKAIFSLSKEKTTIICPVHGEFEQRVEDHLHGHGCPACGLLVSKGEDEICNMLLQNNISIERRNRTLLNRKEIDILIPSLKIGIEFEGLRWHAEPFRGKWYHNKKTAECENNGYKLIHIFEDDWLYKKDIVKHKILHILKCNNAIKIGARKCIISEINIDICKNFLEKYHLQGFVSSSVYIGAYYSNILVGVMTFKYVSKEMKTWELNRYATNWDYSISGLASKLFIFFVRKYSPMEVKSFLDRCWNTEKWPNVYKQLGFELEKILPPDYKYVINGKRVHKFNCRKQILAKKFNLSLSLTETEMAQQLGYHRIWDCGLVKYIWKNDKRRDIGATENISEKSLA